VFGGGELDSDSEGFWVAEEVRAIEAVERSKAGDHSGGEAFNPSDSANSFG
jgi:hypothetical protein